MRKLFTVLFLLAWASSASAAQYIPDSAISPAFTRDAEIVPTGETNAVCVGNTGTPTPSIALCATVDVTGKTVYYKPPEVAIANLPANHGIAIVTDAANSSTCSSAGGSTKVVCWWNGSAWTPLGSGGGGTGDVTDVNGTSNEICVTSSTGPAPTVALCSTVSLASKILQLGRWDLVGDITPTALAAPTADWNPTNLSTASTIRVTCTGAQSISGLQGGADGRILTIYNVGSAVCTLLNENSGSTASNRFAFGLDIALQPNQGIILQYDAVVTGGRWRSLSTVALPSDSHYCADAGSTDAYACTLSPAITAYKVGSHYLFKANTANTGAATVALNGLSAITIKKPIGGVTTDLDNNDIRAGQIVEVVYDGTNFQMVSILGNSSTGISGLTTGTIPQAASSTTLSNSSLSEDATNTKSSKPMIIGDCSTNCGKIKATNVSGQQDFQLPSAGGMLATTADITAGVGARVYKAADQAISNNTDTAINFDSERYDTNTLHDTVTNNTRITISAGAGAGKYLIGCNIRFEANATGTRVVAIKLNGSTIIGQSRTNAVAEGGFSTVIPPLGIIYDMSVSDYVEIIVTQTSGGSLNVQATGNYSPEFWIQKVGS